MSRGFEEAFVSFVWLGLFGAILIAVGVFAFFLLPALLLAGAIFGGAYYYYHSPRYKEQKAKEHTHALYETAKAQYGVEPDVFTYRVDMNLPGSLPEDARLAFLSVAEELTELEGFAELRHPPPICNSIEAARYRDYLASLSTKGRKAEAETGARVLAEALYSLAKRIPPQSQGEFTVSLTDVVQITREDVEKFIEWFYAGQVKQSGIFSELRRRFDANIAEVEVLPTNYKGDDYIHQYLKHTPFLRLFELPVPFRIPEDARFEHHWIVSPPGSGKSTTLQYLINQDLDHVGRGEASVIVMESNRDLIKAIEGLDRFGSGGDLEGRLVLIDCEDVEWPIALNLFDVGIHDVKASSRDKEALLNSAVSMLDYVFRALLGAELTSRQSTLFNFSIQLLLQIPGATLDTLIDMMSIEQLGPFEQHLRKLDADAQKFFELKFFSKEFEQTKAQVTDRLFAVKRIRTLSRMFSAEKTRLDLYREMGEGKVILINCAKSLLQEEGVEIVSRFFLAMILLAAEKRQLLPQCERLPTYVYLDECQDVIRRDEKLPIILDQARKFRVAMVLAHQRLDQMQPAVLHALYGSTAIKFASKLYDTTLARHMNSTAEFIRDQKPYHYAVSIRGSKALALRIPFIDMEKLPHMSDVDHERLQAEMRTRYAFKPKPAVLPTNSEAEVPEPSPAAPAQKAAESSEEIRPSSEL